MIPKGFKPLLAVNADLAKIRFPVWASPKLDGIRCTVFNGVAYSRKLIRIPNEYIQAHVSAWRTTLEGHDGELIVGAPTGEGVFNRSTRGVMSKDGSPKFTFHVFDIVQPSVTFSIRYGSVSRFIGHKDPHFVQPVQHGFIDDLDELEAYEEQMLRKGYEGVMIRSPHGLYKYGRSTVNEGILLKLKRFTDEEATAIGFVEEMHNGNQAVADNLGRTKRSSHKANKTGKGTLGKLVCRSDRYADSFCIGTGFTAEQRQHIWDNRDKYQGKLVKFKHQPYGQKDAPRTPVFLGWRDERDT